MGTSRNAPCPCGSGKKTKLCCGSSAGSSRSTREDWFEALIQISAFAQERFEEHCERGMELFWGAWIDALGEEAARRLLETREVNAGLICYIALDLEISGKESTVCRSLLEEQGADLRAGVRHAIELLAGSHVTPYEVRGVPATNRLRLARIPDGEEIEASGFESTDYRTGELVATRIVDDAGELRLVGDSYDFPASFVGRLAKSASAGELDSRSAFHLWLESFLSRGLVGASLGEEGLESWFVRFAVEDEEAVVAALAAGGDDMEHVDEGRWDWTPPGDEGERRIEFFLADKVLLAAVPTRELVEDLRAFADGAFGDAARHEETVRRNLSERLQRVEGGADGSDIPAPQATP